MDLAVNEAELLNYSVDSGASFARVYPVLSICAVRFDDGVLFRAAARFSVQGSREWVRRARLAIVPRRLSRYGQRAPCTDPCSEHRSLPPRRESDRESARKNTSSPRVPRKKKPYLRFSFFNFSTPIRQLPVFFGHDDMINRILKDCVRTKMASRRLRPR